MDYTIVVAIELLRAIAGLVLISTGLAIIFGMMRVINIAHGEFMMLGGYTVVLSAKAGVNIWIAMLVLAPLTVGLFGVLVERLIIRHLYGRIIDTLLATWGLSLFLIGFVAVVFGNTLEGVATPFYGIAVGQYSVAAYTMFLIGSALAVVASIYLTLKYSRAGLIARATMQNPEMVEALGVNSKLVFMTTFGIGAAFSGLAGALLAPISGVIPGMGVNFIGPAFITVVTGGPSIIAGTLSASGLLGAISQSTAFLAGPVYGDAMLFFAALVLLRLLPQGITGRLFTRSL
ncbi:ABC transporter permease subunit [Ruegeria arenilitoris]|uniref:ABC transporter permease subunit n=1 Tax=Ruegeria arenilitoris TaxID=1173585 RepID=UPI00147C7470|nr:branched-chain amino acid ABC transporter permease [Ruegeria arenilitoris]